MSKQQETKSKTFMLLPQIIAQRIYLLLGLITRITSSTIYRHEHYDLTRPDRVLLDRIQTMHYDIITTAIFCTSQVLSTY